MELSKIHIGFIEKDQSAIGSQCSYPLKINFYLYANKELNKTLFKGFWESVILAAKASIVLTLISVL
jgi:hypothetical protein